MAKDWENVKTMAQKKLVTFLDEIVKENHMPTLVPHICALMISMFQFPENLSFWFKFDSANAAINSASL